MKTISLRATLVAVLFALTTLAQAADRYSDKELMDMLKGEGYGAVSQRKDGQILVKIEGRSYLLINNSDGDLQLYYGISGAKVSCSDINEWNKTKRLSRAYLDNDNDPVIESDLLSNGGLNPKRVTEFFRVFLISVDAFRKMVSDHSN